MSAMEQTLEVPAFTAADRCDRCGAQAKARRLFKAGELLFCGHHDHEYAKTLEVERDF